MVFISIIKVYTKLNNSHLKPKIKNQNNSFNQIFLFVCYFHGIKINKTKQNIWKIKSMSWTQKLGEDYFNYYCNFLFLMKWIKMDQMEFWNEYISSHSQFTYFCYPVGDIESTLHIQPLSSCFSRISYIYRGTNQITDWHGFSISEWKF